VIDFKALRISFLAGTLGRGGAERQLFYILKELRGNGADVRLLSLTRGEFWEQPIKELDIPVIWVGEKKNRFTRLWRIYEEIRDFHPHIFQSQHFYTNFYVSMVSHWLDIKDIGGVRNNGDQDFKSVDIVGRYLCLYWPNVLAVNSLHAIHYLSTCMGVSKTKLKYLPNVIDLKKFHPSSTIASDVKKNALRIISVGRLVEQKRFDKLIRMISRIHEKFPEIDMQLEIIGEGPKRKELEQMTKSMHLSNKVTFTGEITEVEESYRQAQMLVLTSDWEGTPNVILEAMASGLPVVSTRVGGIPEIVTDGVTGFLVDSQDEDGLLDAVHKLICNPRLRETMGTQARQKVVMSYSPDKLKTYLSELYRMGPEI
jgi:glycosyltransferase involved in cell wall biosynthesis